jgi:hypothetical protein
MAPVTPAHSAPRAARPTPSGQREGIIVHGYWVIDVRNPNGKLVSHTEFENSLQTGGQFLLATLLKGYVPGDWLVELDGAGGDTQQPCTNPASSAPGPCGIAASGGYFATNRCSAIEIQCFPTLNLTGGFTPPAQQQNTLTFQGTATASVTGMITDVETLMNICYPSSTASACQTTAADLLTSGPFTAATLPQSGGACGGTGQISCAVPVSAGQTINVSVTLSFQ